MKLLSRAEEMLLLAVWRLQEEAYGLAIRDEVSQATDYTWSIGAVYAPLQRLEKKGYVTTRMGTPVAERGGRSKVYYRLTPAGKKALTRIQQVHAYLWTGIPALT